MVWSFPQVLPIYFPGFEFDFIYYIYIEAGGGVKLNRTMIFVIQRRHEYFIRFVRL